MAVNVPLSQFVTVLLFIQAVLNDDGQKNRELLNKNTQQLQSHFIF